MIDVEFEIYNDIADTIRETYPTAFITGEYVPNPAKFPAVMITEMDNTQVTTTQDSGSLENHARITFEANVYSNKTTGKKQECKKIAQLIDEKFATLGFTRMMYQPVPNLADATIYRIYARYTAIISKEKVIYRR